MQPQLWIWNITDLAQTSDDRGNAYYLESHPMMSKALQGKLPLVLVATCSAYLPRLCNKCLCSQCKNDDDEFNPIDVTHLCSVCMHVAFHPRFANICDIPFYLRMEDKCHFRGVRAVNGYMNFESIDGEMQVLFSDTGDLELFEWITQTIKILLPFDVQFHFHTASNLSHPHHDWPMFYKINWGDEKGRLPSLSIFRSQEKKGFSAREPVARISAVRRSQQRLSVKRKLATLAPLSLKK